MSGFAVPPGMQLLLRDVGIRPSDVLRQAELPGDLFARGNVRLTTDEYFRLCAAIEREAKGKNITPLRVVEALSAEGFDPPIFAALCSPNLNVALERIAHYKRLVMPMVLEVGVRHHQTTVEISWLDATIDPPPSLIAIELGFFVQLARMATRAAIKPLEVRSPKPLEPKVEFRQYFGTPVRAGARPYLAFAASDATRPFLTANEQMWKFFEPGLQRRLSELDEAASMSERVHAGLLELLPSGTASMDAVATRLGTSSRTLQRRLKEEGTTFQELLGETRHALGRHYLKTTDLSSAEISFLLGFEDPNSFFRAFSVWAGETPERARESLRR